MSAPTVLSKHLADHDRPELQPGACARCRAGFRTCRKKRRYNTADLAHDGAVAFNVANDWARPLVAYRCCYCTLWHLTSAKTPAQLKRVRAMRRNVEQAIA